MYTQFDFEVFDKDAGGPLMKKTEIFWRDTEEVAYFGINPVYTYRFRVIINGEHLED